jgi:propionyl-CoA carboxylase alpha chain
VLHLGERECSIQRRHQKVIEEAPSPFLDEDTRRAMGEQATALARAVDYRSAGTVEFIVDAERKFYFLEMNTRLQVEHPVTELVTGLDLVEEMLKIAAGEKLTLTQEQVRRDGWAIEARVYAEDPSRGFLPSGGRLRRYVEPDGEAIRVDSGVVEGSEVTLFYDPMIAKLCSHGPDRATAIERLSAALDGFYIRGPGHNAAFLTALLNHRRFRQGDISTDFIAAEFGERFAGVAPSDAARTGLAAVAVALRMVQAGHEAAISGQLPGWRPRPRSDWVVRLGDENIEVRARLEPPAFVIDVGNVRHELLLEWRPGQPLARATSTGRTAVVQVEPCAEGFRLTHGGSEVEALVRTREAAELAARIPPKPVADTSRFVLSPMPGLIVSVAVAAGETVKLGQELAVLEAMKMENVLRAERDGVVETIHIEPGATVAADQMLIAFAQTA